MSRTYFPTRNNLGVRDMSRSVTLGSDMYDGYRGPAEPAAKAAMTPVNLGGLGADSTAVPPASNARRAFPEFMLWRGRTPIMVDTYQDPSPSVSSQSTPTPQVAVPAAQPPTVIYVTSGGGTASPAPASTASAGITQSPATSTVSAAASAPLTDQVAGWLSGTTPIGSWNVPNALLTGGVVLAFALLMNSSGGKRR